MNRKPKKTRRSNVKIVTKESKTLKHLRELQKLSLIKASKKIGISEAKLNHCENGRCDLDPVIILKIISAYGYSYPEFIEFTSGKKHIPENRYEDCVNMIRRLDKDKLRTIKAILESF